MSDLETRLGYKLCKRGRAGFQLTERGRKAYVAAVELMQFVENTSNELYSLRGKMTGRLKFGIVDASPFTAPSCLFVDVIREFNNVANDIELELIVEPAEILESMVLSGGLHAAIGPFRKPLESLNSTPLYKEENDVYIVNNYKELAPDLSSTQEYIDHFRVVVQRFQQEADLQKFQINQHSALISSVEAILQLILSGGYVGYLPVLYASTWERKGLIKKLDSERFRIFSTHSLISRKSEVKVDALNLLNNLIRKYCETLPK